MRMILEFVTDETCGMPCESLKMMPICDGVIPFFAIFPIMSLISSGVILHHAGADRLYGRDDLDIPLPLLCIRPMFAYVIYINICSRGKTRDEEKGVVSKTIHHDLLIDFCAKRAFSSSRMRSRNRMRARESTNIRRSTIPLKYQNTHKRNHYTP